LSPSILASYSAVDVLGQAPTVSSSNSDIYTGISCDGKNVVCLNK
jgi:hypothetical protein